MKRINWFKTLGLSAATIAAVSPIAIMATSCTVRSMTVDYFTYATLKDAATSGYKFDTYKNGSVSIEKLLIGDLHITDGNFMIIVGANKMGSTCKFFSGDTAVRTKKDWFGESYFPNSILYKAITEGEKVEKEKVPFTIFNIVDYSPDAYYDKKGKRIYISKNGRTPDKYIHPFQKWTKDLIDTTHRFNYEERSADLGGSYDWDKESVTAEKDYIRNDDSAVAYRRICELGAKLYPKSDKEPKRTTTFSTDTTDASRLVIFKAGKLTHLDSLPADGKALSNLINTNFLKDEEEKKQ